MDVRSQTLHYFSLFLCVLTCATAAHPYQPNMNGNYYPLTNTPHSNVSKFPKTFAAYGRNITSFDIYSPLISQLYSQVFWKGLPPVDLPPHIVHQFHNKGMAVVGFEMDQVRRVKHKDGTTQDVSVPLNVVYNHHFESTMIGSAAKFTNVVFTGSDDPRLLALEHTMGGHGISSRHSQWLVEARDNDAGNSSSSSSLPSAQAFGGANGGEYRLSYHGYAPGFAQVLESPTQFQITPMQIDTWNRDKMSLTGPTTFVPGPVPRSSLAPTEGPDAVYSGLLECPLTTRVQKNVRTTYTIGSRACRSPIGTVHTCAAAAQKTLGNGTRIAIATMDNTTNTTAVPVGCSATSDSRDASLAHVVFRATPTTPTTASSPSSPVPCGGSKNGNAVSGSTQSLVNVSVSMDTNTVRITLKGPASVWFGVGFNATSMKDQPWAIIVEGGGKGNVTERRLHDQNPGVLLQPTIKVVSTTVVNDIKTVTVERGVVNPYYTFDLKQVAVQFINAIGSQPLLSYHKTHAPSVLTLLPVQNSGSGTACICAAAPAPFGKGQGTLTYVANASQPHDVGGGTVSFVNKCPPQPRSDLLMQQNPTCDVRTYVGGQTSCHHMWSLLDADQEIPWPNQPLEYHLKFRFWVQEYNASYHQQLVRDTWGIASPVEYDVPKCTHGMVGCSKNPIDGSWMHTIVGTYSASQGKLVAGHFHCHAPTCLSIAMYRCNKTVDVCNATNGELLCEEKPIYGGTGHLPASAKKFDEPGYILQPPCLWGNGADGLEDPVDVDPDKYVLGSVKTSNATYGHHGEMAWQQMYLIRDGK